LNTKTALLVIDAQVNMFDESFQIYQADRIISTISGLIEKARSSEVPVIYLRNNGPEGEPDEPGTPGWEIHPAFAPKGDEIVIDKFTSDSFHETELKVKFDMLGIQRLFIAGMQTEMCVNTTTRKAVELGYEVTLVKDGHSTFDFEDAKAADTINRFNKELSEFAQIVNSENVEL